MAPIAIETEFNQTAQSQIPLGEYIFRKLRSLQVKTIFGVPGDFNLSLLEHLYSVPDLKWCGGCNELNAGYSADGYARVTQGLGVVITTFGVGELSAINAISGAFAEYVPVLHIVGTSPLVSKAQGENLHHLISNKSLISGVSNHKAYENMVDDISCCVESLDDLSTAVSQVDNVISRILENKRPGYLYIPVELADKLVLVSEQSYETVPTFSADRNLSKEVALHILEKIYSSKNQVVLGDILVDRFKLTDELRSFISLTNLPNFSTFMGKSILDESNATYVGDYIGNESDELIQGFVKKSDCLIHFGNYYNEINSGHDTLYLDIDENNIIQLNHEFIKIGKQALVPISFTHVLPHLLELVDPSKIKNMNTSEKLSEIKRASHQIKDVKTESPISQTDLLKQLQLAIQPNDVIVVETGSVMFGLPDLILPKNTKLIGEHFYLSIGYALPSCVGVMMGLQDMNDLENRRVILIEGDGSAQMTIQELSSFAYNELNPLVLLINNNGYTVERIIKGPFRDYNDIKPDWQWTELFKAFGGNPNKIHTKVVNTIDELSSGLNEMSQTIHKSKAKMLEIKLDKLDVPWRFQFMTNKSQKKSAQ